MEDDDDDLYGGESAANGQDGAAGHRAQPTNGNQAEGEEGEAMEDDDDDAEYESDSDDVNIKTEKDDPKTKITKPDVAAFKPPDPDQKQRSHSRGLSGSSSSPRLTPAQPSKPRVSQPQSSRPGTDYPTIKSSTVDPNAPMPEYTLPTGQSKPLTDVDFDADLAEHTKPWRLPGTDQSEYFNYGFDEFTWAMYCLRQKDMRGDIAAQKDHNKQFEMMFSGGGMPGMPPGAQMPGMPPQQPGQGQQGGMAGVPDMNDPMVQQMLQQMMANGVDPNQMDFGTIQQYQAQAMQQAGMQQGMGGQMGGNPNVPQGAPAGPSGGGQGGYGDGGQGYGGRGGRRQRQRGGWQ